MNIKNFIPIDEVIIRNEVIETKFACDLTICKGACCTMESDLGAPLAPEELPIIEEILPEVLGYLPKRSKNEILNNGFYEIKGEDLFTKSIDNKDCVFVYYEGDIAKCAIEKAYFDGKVTFKKPISCHLFPIRISGFGGDILRYEEFSECKPALKKGEEEDVSISEFCKESLERKYGEEWYQKLSEVSGRYVKS